MTGRGLKLRHWGRTLWVGPGVLAAVAGASEAETCRKGGPLVARKLAAACVPGWLLEAPAAMIGGPRPGG